DGRRPAYQGKEYDGDRAWAAGDPDHGGAEGKRRACLNRREISDRSGKKARRERRFPRANALSWGCEYAGGADEKRARPVPPDAPEFWDGENAPGRVLRIRY